MSVVRNLWGKMPVNVKRVVRAVRYPLIRTVAGCPLRVAEDGFGFLAGYGNVAEYRAVKGFLGFEPEFLASFREASRTSEVIFDVGAFIGLYSLTAACCNPKSSVFPFEAQATNCESIIRNAKLNDFDCIHVHQLAIGDTITTLHFDPGGSAGSVSTRRPNGKSKRGASLMVPATTLDALVENSGFPAPDLVKIDVEGYEAHVVRGMKCILQQHRPIVLMEVHARFMQSYGESVEALDRFMADNGYRKEVLRSPGAGKRTTHSQTHVRYEPMNGGVA